MKVSDVAHLHAPHLWVEHRGADLEIREGLRGAALGQPEPSPCGGDQHGADARRPAFLGKKRQQCLRFLELAGLDRDVGQNRRQ